jgi:hypothetical protein
MEGFAALRLLPSNYSGLPSFVGWRFSSGPTPRPGFGVLWFKDSYLVDSASSHMLVSKIKPCMSKYKQSIR